MPLSQVGIATLIGLFGLYGGFYFPALMALMAMCALYLFVRRALPTHGEWIAALATLFCILNSIQIWFARETLWETTGEFLLFAALWGFALLMQGQQKPVRYLGATFSGFAFGMIGLAHAQAPLYWLPLVVWLVYARLTRRLTRADGLFWLAFGVMLLHTLIHVFVFALGYVEGIYHNPILDTLRRAQVYIPLALVTLVVLGVLDRRTADIRRAESWLMRPRVCGRLLWAAALLVLSYLLYSYVVRPGLFSPNTLISTLQHPARLTEYIGAPIERIGNAIDAFEAGKIKSNGVNDAIAQTNLVRLGWYFLPLGMLLAFVGVAALIRRSLTPALGLFISSALTASIFFADNSYTTPNFIYSARRFVPITVPAFSIFIAYALVAWLPTLWGWLSRRVLRLKASPTGNDIRRNIGAWLGGTLALVMVAFFVVTGRAIIAHTEYAGALADVRAVAEQLAPNDIAVFCCTRDEDGKIAAPLTYIFGRQSFTINGDKPNNVSLAALFEQWKREGHNVKLILGTNGGKLSPVGFDVVAQQDENITVRQFEQLAAQKPYNVINPPIVLSYGLYDLRRQATTASTTPGFGSGAPTNPEGWRLAIGALDYAGLGGGFYNRETDTSGAVFRWTGSDPGQLRLPCLRDGRSGELSLTLSGYRPPVLNAKPVPVTVWLSDNVYTTFDKAQATGNPVIGNLTLGSDTQTYTVTIPPNHPGLSACAAGRDNTFIVNLSLPKDALWSPADAHISTDARKLGIKVMAVGLKAN